MKKFRLSLKRVITTIMKINGIIEHTDINLYMIFVKTTIILQSIYVINI
jgi:hypothetical protein